MADLRINLLGGLEIVGSEGKPLTRKSKAVAAFLALQPGQPQSREKIATLFWENSPEEQARTNLRQCLSALRKHFDGALIADADTVWLDPSAVDTDVRQLEELTSSADQDALKQAVTLYKGDLLDGFGLKEEAFEAWIRTERERVRSLVVDGFITLVDQAEAASQTATTVKYATRLLAIDPLNENVHRALMRTYAAQGRYDASLKQFEVCKNVLQRELSVQPQEETVAIYNSLKSERKRRGDSHVDNAPAVYIGSELEKLGINFSRPSKPSIILLPFKDLSANGELSHLAEGIRIDVQSALVKISGLFVIAAGSAEIYAGRTVHPDQVSQEMGVQHVLVGSVQGNTEQIRVTTQLNDGTSGQVVWSERYDRKLDENFLVQDEIVERIVTSLDVKLVSGEQARVWRKTLRNPKALELYYKGLELLATFNKQSVAEAREHFKKVSEISPNVTLGPTCVAFCYYWDATMGWAGNASDALDRAEKWSQRAAAMDDADGQAHAILAHVLLLRGRHADALKIAEEAIKIRPLCANTNALSGNILLYCGKPKEAIERVKSAIRFAPVYASWWLEILASANRDAGQNELAVAAANELLQKHPDNISGFVILASTLVADNRLQLAQRHAANIMALDPEFSLSRYALQHPYENQETLKHLLANLRKAGLPE